MDLQKLESLGFSRAEVLAHLLGGGGDAATLPVTAHPLIGKPVLIRDHMAGVFVGILAESNDKAWVLKNARKIHYWTKAGAVQGLASGQFGADSRITRMVPENRGFNAVEIVSMEPGEYAAVLAAKVWTP